MMNMYFPTLGFKAWGWVSIAPLILLFLSSCDTDSENGPQPRERHFDFKNECQSIGRSTSAFGFMTQFIGTRYDRPMFNPHDADELLYHERGDGFSRIIKYRISTKEKEVFLDDAPVTLELDWGRGGWVAFSGYGDMYLIREDGTNLHSIPLSTEGHSCAEPDWNPDGTVVGFPFGGVDGISLYGMYLLFDIDKEKVDTLLSYNGSRPLDWSITNKLSQAILNSAKDKVLAKGFIDMETFKESIIFNSKDRKWTGGSEGGGDVVWSADAQSLFNSGGHIICYPLDEYKEIRIKKGCESSSYEDLTISPDNKHIVVERVDIKRQGPFSNTLEERHRLFIMDIDGCNERLLLDDE